MAEAKSQMMLKGWDVRNRTNSRNNSQLKDSQKRVKYTNESSKSDHMQRSKCSDEIMYCTISLLVHLRRIPRCEFYFTIGYFYDKIWITSSQFLGLD